jgi:Copper transport outer membrane protein, MctB
VINFRYHLVSIIAVLLALSIGIVTGSGFLGGPLLEGIKGRVNDLELKNHNLQEQVVENKRRSDGQERAFELLQSDVVEGKLAGEDVVVVDFAGSDEGLDEGIRDVVAQAGGRVATVLTFSDDLVLDDSARREELAAVLAAPADDGDALRRSVAEEVGRALGSASRQTRMPSEVDALVDALESTRFLTVERASEVTVPFGALFVVAASGPGQAAFPVADFGVRLSTELARKSTPVVATEAEDSSWGLVAATREDPEASERVWTVDNANEAMGRIAVAFALDRSIERPAQDFGTDPGAEVIPSPPAG